MSRKARGAAPLDARATAATALNYERRCFHIDRSIVARQLRSLWRLTADGASDLAMTLAEEVFDDSVGAALAQTAHALHESAHKLRSLHSLVVRARFPGTAGNNGKASCRRLRNFEGLYAVPEIGKFSRAGNWPAHRRNQQVRQTSHARIIN